MYKLLRYLYVFQYSAPHLTASFVILLLFHGSGTKNLIRYKFDDIQTLTNLHITYILIMLLCIYVTIT